MDPPCKSLPSLKMTALSYSWTTLKQTKSEKGSVTMTINQENAVNNQPQTPIPTSTSSAENKRFKCKHGHWHIIMYSFTSCLRVPRLKRGTTRRPRWEKEESITFEQKRPQRAQSPTDWLNEWVTDTHASTTTTTSIPDISSLSSYSSSRCCCCCYGIRRLLRLQSQQPGDSRP